jgi:hypothetical protein
MYLKKAKNKAEYAAKKKAIHAPSLFYCHLDVDLNNKRRRQGWCCSTSLRKQIEQIGLRRAGFPDRVQQRTKAKTNQARFVDAFGTSPKVCSVLFDDIQQRAPGDAAINNPNIEYFL